MHQKSKYIRRRGRIPTKLGTGVCLTNVANRYNLRASDGAVRCSSFHGKSRHSSMRFRAADDGIVEHHVKQDAYVCVCVCEPRTICTDEIIEQ